MPTGYTRQSAAEIVTGQTVNASSFNNEFNAIQAAMDATTGHTHDGTVGGGAPITLTTSVTGILPLANGGTNASTAAGARTNLGLTIGTNVQAYDAGLQSISGLTTAADKMIYTTALDTYAVADLTAAGRALLDDADATAQRTTLGLGTLSTQNANSVSVTGGTIAGITNLAIADGTAASPSITNDGDLDTGFYFPAANTIGVTAAGVERLRFSTTGVGVNVATPAYSFDIVDAIPAAAHNGFVFREITDTTRSVYIARTSGSYSYNGISGSVGQLYSSTSLSLMADSIGGNNSILFSVGGSIRAQLQWDGKFGIGTTSPATTLDVNGDVTITDKIIHSGDTDTSIRFPAVDTVTVETGGVERLRVDANGIDVLGQAKAEGFVGDAQMSVPGTQTVQIAASGSIQGIYTISASGGGNHQKMLVAVAAQQYASAQVTVLQNNNYTGSDLLLNPRVVGSPSGDTRYFVIDTAGACTVYAGGFGVSPSLSLSATPSGSTGIGNSYPLYVNSNSAVGIGTTNPSDILHVESSGTSRVRVKTTTASARTDLALVNSSNIVTAVYGHDGTNAEIDYRTGNLQFKYIGVTQATLSTSGQLGIGTTPSEQLHITGNFRIGSAVQATPSGSAPLYAARAWVNFNGTGTVAIRASGNVTSITDNNTGDYTVNFTTAMPDANYSVVGTHAMSVGTGAAAVGVIAEKISTGPAFSQKTTTAVNILTVDNSSDTLNDAFSANVAIFR